MLETNYNNYESFLEILQKQFLCCYPLHCIQWKIIPKNISWAEQKELIDCTYKSQLNHKMPIKLSYQLNFLKKLIQHLENNTNEVHDVIYESLCEVQQNVVKDLTEKFAFKHYIINNNVYFSLKESKSFVTAGTTGLCSWQASLALADYLLQYPELIRDQNVLELGSGTGLCGFIIQKLCQPQYLLLTDGSSACIDLLIENMKLNFPEGETISPNTIQINGNILGCCILNWKTIHLVDKVKYIKPNVLLAADVVYDDSVFDDLTQAINYVFNLNNQRMKMFLAATIRNEFTLKSFLKKLKSLNFIIDEIEGISLQNSRLHWDRTTPVKILTITR